MNTIFLFDSSALLWIQEHLRMSLLDPFFQLITHLGDAGLVWIWLGIGLLCFSRTRRSGIAVLIALGLTLVVNNLLLKNMIDRARPFEVVEGLQILVGRPLDSSFPSGHSCASFAAATALWPYSWRRVRILVLGLAVLIAFSRLYVGVHFPTDVAAGCVLGCVLGRAAYCIEKKQGVWK